MIMVLLGRAIRLFRRRLLLLLLRLRTRLRLGRLFILALLRSTLVICWLIVLGFGRVEYSMLIGLLGRPSVCRRIHFNWLQLVELGLCGLWNRLERLIVLRKESYVAHLEGA